MIWLGVAAASMAGAVGRYGVMAGLEGRLDRDIPWGTALVNVSAAFLLGLLAGSSPAENTARLLGAGFLGSFSTFSTWMVEGIFLAGTGTPRQLIRAGWWVGGMLAIGVAAFGWGHMLAR
ncbi:MAG: fluoride efflux transporter FluC [Acidimicrobiia bacterium]